MPPAPRSAPDPDDPEPTGSRPVPAGDGDGDGAPEPSWSDEEDSAAYLVSAAVLDVHGSPWLRR
jgi:hypothetical protein